MIIVLKSSISTSVLTGLGTRSPLHEQKSSGWRLDCKSTVNSLVQLRRSGAQRCEQKKKKKRGICTPLSERLEQARDVRSEKTCPDLHAKTSFSLSERRTFHEVLLFSVWGNKVAPN